MTLDEVKWEGAGTLEDLVTWGVLPIKALAWALRTEFDNQGLDGSKDVAVPLVQLMVDLIYTLQDTLERLMNEVAEE